LGVEIKWNISKHTILLKNKILTHIHENQNFIVGDLHGK